LQQAVEYAWSKGTVIVASAGNRASSTPSYPAAYPHVISVGAMDINNVAWEKSNYGSWIQIYSPGVAIYSTLPGNRYGYMSGTSMGTAYVSSIAAQCFNQVTDQNSDGKVNDEVTILLKELFSEYK
jgi:thermitase